MTHARQQGIHLSQSNGLAERLVGLAKQCARRLRLASSLPDFDWSYALRFAAEMLRRKALGFPWSVPAFGEEVGIPRSHDKMQAKAAHHKGVLGRLIALDPWGNGTSVLIAKGSDFMILSLLGACNPRL